ncbi:MAG: hypothetical protein JSS09_07905 [Verrucomicrobia bacterium]|nr:hypothetical protein [Verrucomicrobiota bacterium]
MKIPDHLYDLASSTVQGMASVGKGAIAGVQGLTLGAAALVQGIIGSLGTLFLAAGKSLNPLAPGREGSLSQRSLTILKESAETCLGPAHRATVLALGTFSACLSKKYLPFLNIPYPSAKPIEHYFAPNIIDPLLFGTALIGLSGRPEVTINVLQRQIQNYKNKVNNLKLKLEKISTSVNSSKQSLLFPQEELLFKDSSLKVDPMEDPTFSEQTNSITKIRDLGDQRARLREYIKILETQIEITERDQREKY